MIDIDPQNHDLPSLEGAAREGARGGVDAAVTGLEGVVRGVRSGALAVLEELAGPALAPVDEAEPLVRAGHGQERLWVAAVRRAVMLAKHGHI